MHFVDICSKPTLFKLIKFDSCFISCSSLIRLVNTAYVVPAVAGFIIFTRLPFNFCWETQLTTLPKFDNKILRKGVKYVQSVFIVDFEHI